MRARPRWLLALAGDADLPTCRLADWSLCRLVALPGTRAAAPRQAAGPKSLEASGVLLQIFD